MDTVVLTADQRAKERSVWLGIILDVPFLMVMVGVSLAGGSFTLMAESIRGWLAVALECFTFSVLRRIHRGVLADLDYGTGKLEQVANMLIGGGMLFGAIWIVIGALRILSGESDLGTPFGLACAAVVGMLNVYINLLVWDSTRRAAAAGDSLIMKSQLVVRWTKLFASMVVIVGMTVAALSTDDLIVAWADALGSLFVAGYMTLSGLQVMRAAVPDLLDRSAGQAVHRAIDEVLAGHAASYARVQRIRSRRGGHTVFVEIALEFDPGLDFAEVDRRVVDLKSTLRERLDDADIAILASAS